MRQTTRVVNNIVGRSSPPDRNDDDRDGDHPSFMTRTTAVVRATLGTLGLALAVLSACDAKKATAKPRLTTARDSADQVLYGAHSVLATNGLKRGELSGDTVLAFDAATRFEFQGLRAQFTTSLGRPLAVLTAPSGTYHIGATTIVEAHGPVTIVSDTSHRRLTVQTARYDIAKNQIVSDSAFVVNGGTKRFSGIGFTADPGLFTVKCLKNCVGTLGP